MHEDEQGTWEERYVALIPEHVDAAFVREFLELYHEDAVRMIQALHEFVFNSLYSDEPMITKGPQS